MIGIFTFLLHPTPPPPTATAISTQCLFEPLKRPSPNMLSLVDALQSWKSSLNRLISVVMCSDWGVQGV